MLPVWAPCPADKEQWEDASEGKAKAAVDAQLLQPVATEQQAHDEAVVQCCLAHVKPRDGV